MNNFFAGLMGIVASVGSFFHGGQQAKQPMMYNAVMQNHMATPSGSITPGFGRMEGNGTTNMHGERPFYGTVTAVSGSTITISMQMGMRMMRRPNATVTPSITITPPVARTMTIVVDTATTYSGGSLSDIKIGTSIAGIGKTTGSTTISATKMAINPTAPTGFPNGMPRKGMGREGFGRGEMHGGNQPQ